MNTERINTLTCDFETCWRSKTKCLASALNRSSRRDDFALWLNEQRQGCAQK